MAYTSNKIDMYQQVTDTLVELLETAGTDWLRPWHDGATHRSITNGRPYRGINPLLLGCSAMRNSFKANVWGTYKAWAAKGGQVNKGSRGTRIVFWKWTERQETTDTGEKVTKKSAILRDYVVFNAEQQEGADVPANEPVDGGAVQFEAAESLLESSGATIRHGAGGACYSPALDVISLPACDAFTETKTCTATESYYGTAFHELTHWTGAPTRCDRKLANRFGSEAYAFEELIAEIGAAYLTAATGLRIEPRPDHAQYINNWLKTLKNDKRAVFTAASAAQKAADFVLATGESEDLEMAA